MTLRELSAADALAYRELRLAALRDHPEAYCSDFSEEKTLPLEEFQKRLAIESSPTFGQFDSNHLVGIATLLLSTRVRQQFRATIVGMYVAPAQRGRGIARSLISACVERARQEPDIEEVCLSVTVGNETARRAYIAYGFQPVVIEPRYFKYAGRYYDLEWLRLPLN